MRHVRVYLISVIIMAFLGSQAYCGDQALRMINKYYYKLTEIINNNMDAPDKCVEEIDSFLDTNARWIELIRKAREIETRDKPPQISIITKRKEKKNTYLEEGVMEYAVFERAFNKFAVRYPKQAKIIEELDVHSIMRSSTELLEG